MQAQVKAWENGQGIIIPREVLRDAGISVNEMLDITVSNGVIMLAKTLYLDNLDFTWV